MKMQTQEEELPFRFSKDKCEAMNLHLTDTVISAFDGRICKRCMEK